ncbi:Crp/Fnr family transcriptional regulator, partial [Blautia wexlerae]|nr:Crp/Fnr family transcriptional regulator [Blautia wexlerae]
MFVKEITVMNFENYFPLWNDLNTAQKKIISDN